jgi:M6 family metalloprotease-like protein
MKRFICFLYFFCLESTLLIGANLVNVPQTLTQPNGEILHCFASGDEFFNCLHDSNGYTIIQDPTTAYYVYAEKINGVLVPSKYVVNKIKPKDVGLEKYLRISLEQYNERKISLLKTKGEFAYYGPNSGNINNLVIFIRFKNEGEYAESISKYENIFNKDDISLKNYFREVSYNKLTYNSIFFPIPNNMVISYVDNQPRSYYQKYNSVTNPNGYQPEDRFTREYSLLKNAANAISSQVPTSLNIDSDLDGYIDQVSFVISGSPEGWNDLLWPHAYSMHFEEFYINDKQIGYYVFLLQNYFDVGTVCHEIFHNLGAPDLYHYSFDGLCPVAAWDIMEAYNYPPQHMGAYMKYRYGKWITSIPEIEGSGLYSLRPLYSDTNNCYKIKSPYSENEYFILEYRKNDATKFDKSIYGSGLVIYRINTQKDGWGNSNGPPDEVYIYRPNGTISANGIIENAYFSYEAGRIAINDTTNPSSFLSDGMLGGLDISQIGSAGSTISFYAKLSPYIIVLSPKDGENLRVGTSQNITWTSSKTSDRVKIEYSIDAGNNWLEIAADVPDNGNYLWLIPNTPSKDCLVRVIDIEKGTIGISKDFFMISDAKQINKKWAYRLNTNIITSPALAPDLSAPHC